MNRAREASSWVAVATVLLVLIVSTNLTGFGIGATQLTYDDVALPRLVVALVGALGVWLLLGVGLVGESRAGSPFGTLKVDPTSAILAALAAWSMVSALSSQQGPHVWLGQSERLEGVVTVLLYALVFGAGLQLGGVQGALTALAAALVAGTSVLAGHGVLQMLGLDPTIYTVAPAVGIDANYARATLANANFLGTALVLALPVVVAFALTARSALRATCALLVLLMLAALWGTESQSAWLTAVLEVAFALAWWLSVRRKMRPRAAVGVAAAVVAAGVVAILVVSATVPNLGHGIARSLSERTVIARIAFQSAASHPMTGTGPDGFLAAFRESRGQEYVELVSARSTNNNAHSWPLQYAATLGFPGALLLAGALVVGLWRAWPRSGQRSEADAKPILAAAVWIGLAGMTVNLLSSVAMVAFTVPFWLLLGVMASSSAPAAPVTPRIGSAIASVAGASVLAAVIVSACLLAADAAYLESRTAFRALRHDSAIALADKAAALNPTSVKYARGAAQARLQLALEEGRGVSGGMLPDSFNEAISALEQVEQRWPKDYPVRCWKAALEGWFGVWRDDDRLKRAAGETARDAARLDSVHWEVKALAGGSTSAGSLNSALSAPGLP